MKQHVEKLPMDRAAKKKTRLHTRALCLVASLPRTLLALLLLRRKDKCFMRTNLSSALMAACLCWAPAPLFAAATPTLSISDVTVIEGQTAAFIVTLSAKSSKTIFVNFGTTDGTAEGCSVFLPETYCKQGDDYRGFSVGLEFPPGVVSKTVSVLTRNDTCHEDTEYFVAFIYSAIGASLGKDHATCIIIDNDGPALCCCKQIFGICVSRSSCCCGGVGEGIPMDASTPVGVPTTYYVQWSVPPPEVWRSLNTMDVRLVGEDEEAILTVRWDEALNTFHLLNPGNGEFQQTDVPGSPGRFEGSAVALLLENSEVIGSGPTGPSVLLKLNLIFKPRAAGRIFRVEARITNDAGIEKGYDPVGTITVLPH